MNEFRLYGTLWNFMGHWTYLQAYVAWGEKVGRTALTEKILHKCYLFGIWFFPQNIIYNGREIAFGGTVNPISTRGIDFAHQNTYYESPEFSDLASAMCLIPSYISKVLYLFTRCIKGCTLGFSSSFVSRWREGYIFWSSWGPSV